MKALDFNIEDRVIHRNTEIIKDEIKENETDITTLESGKANISSGSGAPSGGSANDLYVDTANNRLYANVDGTWKYASLT